MPEFTGTQDLRSYLRALWRWKLLFLVLLIGVPAGAYLIDRGKPSVYSSTVLVGVNTTTVNSGGSGGSFTTNNLSAIAALVTTTPVASAAADLLHPPGNAGQIASEVTASADPTTGFLRISAEDHNPTRAADIANAFASAIGANLQDAASNQISSSINKIQAQLSHLGKHGNAAVKAELEQQLVQLRASSATQGSQAAILQPATPASSPIGPHLRRTVEIALIIGLLLGLGAVVLAEGADRRLRTPTELKHVANVPVLATIPPSAFSSKLDTGLADEESFRTLRTALLYFNPTQRRRSVLVTSPGEKDGKTTVAVRLALAAARGGMRVVLIDADLRRAQVAARLGLDTEHGLAGVLAGRRALKDALVSYELGEPGAGQLRVLPAGLPPPDPAALIGSPKMQSVLERLGAICDLVVIDTPAALMVSDPMPLVELVSDVILVARMKRARREEIDQVREMIEAVRGNLVGIVATGASAGIGYGHYRSAYYSSNGNHEQSTNGKLDEAADGAPEAGAELGAASGSENDKSGDSA